MIYCLKGYVNGKLLIHQRCKNFEKSKITEGSKKSMKQKIFIILEMMLAIFVTYVVERVLLILLHLLVMLSILLIKVKLLKNNLLIPILMYLQIKALTINKRITLI